MVKANETLGCRGQKRGLNPGQQTCPPEPVFRRPSLGGLLIVFNDDNAAISNSYMINLMAAAPKLCSNDV
jgi:hypothetical protein